MPEKFTYRVAAPAELPCILRLREDVYRADLGANPEDGYDQGATHMAAYGDRGEVVAVFRILSDAQRPFEFERLYPLDALIESGRRPGMIGKLCVRSSHRKISRSTAILAGLLRLAYDYALAVGITDYFIYALEPLVTFYGRAGFVEVGVAIEHPDWGPLRLMRLAIATQC
jgi:predicted GNAT family N-acyltransferase